MATYNFGIRLEPTYNFSYNLNNALSLRIYTITFSRFKHIDVFEAVNGLIKFAKTL